MQFNLLAAGLIFESTHVSLANLAKIFPHVCDAQIEHYNTWIHIGEVDDKADEKSADKLRSVGKMILY